LNVAPSDISEIYTFKEMTSFLKPSELAEVYPLKTLKWIGKEKFKKLLSVSKFLEKVDNESAHLIFKIYSKEQISKIDLSKLETLIKPKQLYANIFKIYPKEKIADFLLSNSYFSISLEHSSQNLQTVKERFSYMRGVQNLLDFISLKDLKQKGYTAKELDVLGIKGKFTKSELREEGFI